MKESRNREPTKKSEHSDDNVLRFNESLASDFCVFCCLKRVGKHYLFCIQIEAFSYKIFCALIQGLVSSHSILGIRVVLLIARDRTHELRDAQKKVMNDLQAVWLRLFLVCCLSLNDA
jgi:hypothetical protein